MLGYHPGAGAHPVIAAVHVVAARPRSTSRRRGAVVRWWFQQNFERRDVPFLFFAEDEPNVDFEPPVDAYSAMTWQRGDGSVRSLARSWQPMT